MKNYYREKSKRQLKVAEQIKRNICSIIYQDNKFDRLLLSISEVDLSKDLKNAKVFVNVISDQKKENVIENLNKNSKYIRHKLSSVVDNMKYLPKVFFVLDEKDFSNLLTNNF